MDILARAGMVDCKPCATLVDMSTKLSLDGPPVDNTTHYRGLAGALQYLTFTRPDIAFAVSVGGLSMISVVGAFFMQWKFQIVVSSFLYAMEIFTLRVSLYERFA